jgi:hypothetical protein
MTGAVASRGWWLGLAVAAAACLPYVPSIGDYFVQDDFGVVQLLAKRPWSTFPRWFVMPWMEDIWGYTPDELRPFVALTYQLTGKWNPARPELHHVFNIAVHAGCALLVMAIARTAIGLSVAAAAFAGLVFAVLPNQVETVAWITGRVDSMPALLYLGTFLAYVRWRQHRRWTLYAAALALFFVALFSKQNTITMVATLAAYDAIVLTRRERGPLLKAVLDWAPFGVLTVGFLLLRRAVFGHSLRPGLETQDQIVSVATMLDHHVQRTLMGHISGPSLVDLVAAALLVTSVVLIALRSQREARARFVRMCGVFGAIWFVIGVAPVALAGYESSRHAYLASAGWAFMLALILDGLWLVFPARAVRAGAIGAAAAVALIYLVRLAPVMQAWDTDAAISEAATVRVSQEAAAAPLGTLMIVGVPRSSWEWSSPFVLSPPFARQVLTDRVRVVTPWRLHCCGRESWDRETRLRLRGWLESSPRPALIALRFAPDTGAVSRVTDADVPELNEIIPVLLQTTSADALDAVIRDILERIVARRGEGEGVRRRGW